MLNIARRTVALAAMVAAIIAAAIALDFPQPAQAQSDEPTGRIVVRPWVDDDGDLTRVEFGFRPAWGEDVRGGGDGPDDLFPPRRFLTQGLIESSAGRWLRSSEILIPDAEGSQTGVRGRILVRAEADDGGELTRIEFGFRPDWGEDIRGTESGPDDIFPTNRFLTRALIERSAAKWLRSSLITVPAERPPEPAEDPAQATEPTEGVVGAAGGYATAEDGAKITVPAGAAEPGAKITARVVPESERPTPPLWSTDFIDLWDFEVEGGITEPVTLSFPAPQDGGVWAVVGYNDDTGKWELVPFVVENGMISATPDSLSLKGVGKFFKDAISAGFDCGSDPIGCAKKGLDLLADCVAKPKNCIEVAVDHVSDLGDEFWGAAKEGARVIVGGIETGYSYVKRAGEWVVELGGQMVRTIERAFTGLWNWAIQTVPPLNCEDESDNVLATLNPGQVLLQSCAENEGEDEHRLRIKNMRRFWVQVCPGPLVSADLRRAPNADVFGPLSNCDLDGGTLLPSGREAEWISQLESPSEIRATFSQSAALMTMVDWILAIVGASNIEGKVGIVRDILVSLRELPALSQLIDHAEAGRIDDVLTELGNILTSTTSLKHITDVIAKAAPSLGVEFGGSVITAILGVVELGRVPIKIGDLLSVHYSESGTFAAAGFRRTDRAEDDESDDGEGESQPLPPIGDGSLVVLAGTRDLYQMHVVDGSLFKRLILNPVVFDGYGFQLNDVRSVDQAEFDRWATTDLARLGDDAQVWRLFPDGGEGVRRLLDITAEQFEAAGFDWEAVIPINQTEFDAWREDSPITAAELGLESEQADEPEQTDDRPGVGTIRVVGPTVEAPTGGGAVAGPAGTFSTISASTLNAICGLRTGGAIECWGLNDVGQADAPGGAFSAVSAGGGHTCGLRTGGAIECWGLNHVGQADAPGGTFSAVSAGSSLACGLRTGGAVVCWGYNDYGQADAPGGTFSAVSAGLAHTCGLRTSGAVECWGANPVGQTDAPGGSFGAVSASGAFTCGLRAGGAVECWGNTPFGQTNAPGETPPDPDPIIQYVQVFAGDRWIIYNCTGRDTDGDGVGDQFLRDADGNPLPNAAGVNDACVEHGWSSRPLPDDPTVSGDANEPPQCDDIADVGPLSPGEANERIRLSDYCRDPENEPLRYEVASSDDGVATAFISGGSLIVAAARSEGTATITLTAADPGGLTGQTSFRVTVSAPAPEPPQISITCPAYAEARSNFSCTVSNSGGTADAWDWSASGAAAGGRDETYSVWISSFGRHIVRLTASNAGGSDSDSTSVQLVAVPPASRYSRCGTDRIRVWWFDRDNFRKHHVNLTGGEATRILGPRWWATIGHLTQPACDSWPTGLPLTAENYR